MYAPPDQYVPQCQVDRRPIVMWAIVVASALLFNALIIGAPLALANSHSVFALTIYQAFSHLCHQRPERSFFIAGHNFAVCTRCTGLYAGFAAAVLLYPLVRSLRHTETPPRKWLFMAAAPLSIDFILGFFGIWENTHSSRFSTAALLGVVSVFYVMPGLAALRLRRTLSLDNTQKTHHPTELSTITPERQAVAPTDYSAPQRRI
jgi:uncharacterized membrane protein